MHLLAHHEDLIGAALIRVAGLVY